MTHRTELSLPADEPVILVRRRFDAPPALVFRAWTDPELLRQWWLGPPGMAMTHCAIDPREGGAWRMEQMDPGGTQYAFFGEYLRFDPPRRIEQTFRMDMEGLRDEPPIVETIMFEAAGDGTQVTARSQCPTIEARDAMAASGMEEGMNASFARLVDLLGEEQSATSFTIDRVFDAPVDLVWACFTQKRHVDVWMLPERFTLIEQDADVSIGGQWWSKMRDQADGAEWHVGGTYREVVENERLVFTHRWTHSPFGTSSEHLITVTFEDRNRRTHMRFAMSGLPDAQSRDGHREGWQQTLGHLEQHLASLRETAS
ncbi:MAG: SRPBCC domain-containing protein [Roseitalea porphyridii]|jgi:uncharacterized protein YndB with AHSA1/START domain|uniref:SRPBCC domain-containing protein n=1 Tax=Roseitalea porphyridii TaxID=1852022 RepID=UPI0032ECAD63